MPVAIVAGALGVAQGIRHALEPDHLVAVSTLSTERPGTTAGLRLGASWGVGHTLSLLVVGGSLAALRAQLPGRLESGFELVVAVMLVVLGARAVVQALDETLPLHRATHVHAHPHSFKPAPRTVRKALFIGLVHGLAGSGALSALVIAELPTAGARLGYIAVFGFGSVLGMASLTAAVSTPLARLKRAPLWAGRALMAIGLTSVALGVWWGIVSASALALR